MTHVNEWSVPTSRGKSSVAWRPSVKTEELNSQRYVLVFTFSLSRKHKTDFMSRPKMTLCAHKSLITWTISKEINRSHEKMMFMLWWDSEKFWFTPKIYKALKYYIGLNMNLWKGWKYKRTHTKTLSWNSESNTKCVISPKDFPLIHNLLILKLGCCFQFGERAKNIPSETGCLILA